MLAMAFAPAEDGTFSALKQEMTKKS